LTCPVCGFEVADWDAGKPCIAGPDGQRHYWYHPGEAGNGGFAVCSYKIHQQLFLKSCGSMVALKTSIFAGPVAPPPFWIGARMP